MPDYRLYCLSKAGKIIHAHDFAATDDEEAINIASNREHPQYDCELWQERRKVASMPAKTA